MALSQAVYQVRNPICKKGKEYITLFTLLRFCYLTRSHHSVAIFLILTYKFIFQLLLLLSVQISMSFTYVSKAMTFTSPFNFLLLTWNLKLSKLNGRHILVHFFPLSQNAIFAFFVSFQMGVKDGHFPFFHSSFLFFSGSCLDQQYTKLTSGWVLSSKTSPLTSLKPN